MLSLRAYRARRFISPSAVAGWMARAAGRGGGAMRALIGRLLLWFIEGEHRRRRARWERRGGRERLAARVAGLMATVGSAVSLPGAAASPPQSPAPAEACPPAARPSCHRGGP